MKNILLLVEVLVSVGLITSILVQAKGTGLSASFGGGGEFYRSKRGVEKVVNYLTIGLTTIFGIVSVLLLLVG